LEAQTSLGLIRGAEQATLNPTIGSSNYNNLLVHFPLLKSLNPTIGSSNGVP